MSKPVLGYASRTDAAIALQAAGKSNRDIAVMLGVPVSTASALIASGHRAKARSGTDARAPRGKYGMPTPQLEAAIMDLYEAGATRDAIADRIGIRRETVGKIIGYMRIGAADIAVGAKAAAFGSAALLTALRRHHPERCGR